MAISPEVQSAIDEILKAVLAAVVPLIILMVRSFVMAKIADLKNSMTDQQLSQIEYWAGMIVKAIEQSELKEGVERTAEEKLREAVKRLQERADAIGLSGLSIEDYANIIRAKLYDGVHKEQRNSIQAVGTPIGFNPEEDWWDDDDDDSQEDLSSGICAVNFGFRL